jgi:hypothetical protein
MWPRRHKVFRGKLMRLNIALLAATMPDPVADVPEIRDAHRVRFSIAAQWARLATAAQQRQDRAAAVKLIELAYGAFDCTGEGPSCSHLHRDAELTV